MRPRTGFSETEVQMVLSAICFFRCEAEKSMDKRYPVYQTVSDCLGISLISVKRVAAKQKDCEKENTSGDLPTAQKRVRLLGRPKIFIDEFRIGVITRLTLTLYRVTALQLLLRCSAQ